MADERHTYLLQYKPSPFSSDTVEFTIDPKSNLIQTVNATADDKTSQIIVELAKAAAMIAQAAPGPETVILERKIDPAMDNDVTDLVRDMNSVAMTHAARMATTCTDQTAKCVSYRAMQAGPKISFAVGKPTTLAAERPDCRIGICYRAPAPYRLEFSFNGQYSYATVVNLPNDRPAIVLPLDRTLFVKRVDNAEFENGMLKKAHFEKPSEALEIASLPINVMTAVFTSITNLIQAKIDLSDKEKTLAQSQAQLLQAQKDLQDKRIAVAQAALGARGNILLSGSSSGLRILGPVPPIVPTKPQPPAPGAGLTSPSNPGQGPSGDKR